MSDLPGIYCSPYTLEITVRGYDYLVNEAGGHHDSGGCLNIEATCT